MHCSLAEAPRHRQNPEPRPNTEHAKKIDDCQTACRRHSRTDYAEVRNQGYAQDEIRNGASQNIVSRKGLGANLLLVVITTIICVIPSFIPYVGFIIAWFVTPIAWLMIASAYIQEVDEDDGTLADLYPESSPPPEDVSEPGADDQWGPVS